MSQPSTLVYYNPDKTLWIDLDASKKFGFGAVIIHTSTNDKLAQGHWPSSNSLRPIFFLSRLWTTAKKNYWPTELEITGFVWVIKKVRHLVESSRVHVIIQTDHSTILDILQQSSITSTTSTIRLNLPLVRASQFLQQFKLDVRHKPGKEHIIPNVLNQLARANVGQAYPSYSELAALFIYNTTFVEIWPKLISRILAGYKADDYWSCLQRQVQANEDLSADKASFQFVLALTSPTSADPYLTLRTEGEAKVVPAPKLSRSIEKPPQSDNADSLPPPSKTKLLYHINKLTGVHCLCIPPSVAPNIIAIAHGEGNPGFSCCYKIITRSWFIRGLIKLFQTFIRHCPQCLAL